MTQIEVLNYHYVHRLAIECVKELDPLNDLEYVPVSLCTTAPKESGIYFAASDKLLYIGRSINLRHRLMTHRCGNLEFKRVEQLKVAWISIFNLTFLSDLEQYLISFWTPPLNRIQHIGSWENANVYLERSRTSEQIMDSELDLIPIKELWKQYGVGKTTFYMRALSDLQITPVQSGGRSHITAKEKALLDKYYSLLEDDREAWINEQFKRREPFYLPGYQERELTPVPVEAKVEVKVQGIDEIAEAIASIMRPPADPFGHYEQLERFSRFGWLISSADLRQLIRQNPRGHLIEWGGFLLIRVKPRWWRVRKED